jgi:hypothetical protein
MWQDRLKEKSSDVEVLTQKEADGKFGGSLSIQKMLLLSDAEQIITQLLKKREREILKAFNADIDLNIYLNISEPSGVRNEQ